MSLRWRKDGSLVCAATSKERKGDVYIGDGLHYALSQDFGIIIPADDEAKTGRWYWVKLAGPVTAIMERLK